MMPKACDRCGRTCPSESSRMKWCGTPCKQANARKVEGQKRAALAGQLATAQATIRSLTAELEVLRGASRQATSEPMGAVETTLRAMLQHKAIEHGGDAASACTAIAETFLDVLQLAVRALAQCAHADVPRDMKRLKQQLSQVVQQASEPPNELASSGGFTQARRSVAAPAMTVLFMRRTLTEELNPAITTFVAAGEKLGFASVETTVRPLKLYLLSSSPTKTDTNFHFDIYVSVLALTFELLVQFGARAHEYTALALNMAYHIEHNLNWDRNEERAGDAFSAATRAAAKAMLLEAQETPRARSVASSVRQVLSLRQATRRTLTDVLYRVEPECDANTVIVISATTCKEGFKTQLAAAHSGDDAEVSTYGDRVLHIGGYVDRQGAMCGADEVGGSWLAAAALVPIVRAARIGATLVILHVGCFSQQSFLEPLAKLISSVRTGRTPAPRGAVEAAGGDEVKSLLTDDALRRMHVVASTEAVPGDAAVEILVNYARYAGSGPLEEFWRKLMDKLKWSAGFYEHYGIEDPALGQQDVTAMLVMECLATSVANV